jgi:hypothetical protein
VHGPQSPRVLPSSEHVGRGGLTLGFASAIMRLDLRRNGIPPYGDI